MTVYYYMGYSTKYDRQKNKLWISFEGCDNLSFHIVKQLFDNLEPLP